MRFPWLIFLLLVFPALAFAQYSTVTGVVTNAETKKPLAGASVFLSNSSVGSASASDGRFTLNGIRPGQYNLTVTILGYQDFTKEILIGREPIRLDIEMTPKPLMLREVTITSAADWKKNYEMFRMDFIGTDENAKKCVVKNPHILNMQFNRTKQSLEVSSDEFLVVENNALGYQVKFLVKDFVHDVTAGSVHWAGQRLFEDLPGSAEQKSKWHKKREEAYYGSQMHFFRSLYTNKLAQDSFVMYHLNRQLNPRRPSDDVIRRKQRMFFERRMQDSLDYWNELADESKYSKESLGKIEVMPYEVFTTTDRQGIFVFHPLNYLYVMYKKRRDEVYKKDFYRSLEMPNYEASIVNMSDPGYTFFDSNGVVFGEPPLMEGAWALSRLSNMLPVDYVPDVK